ncbi:(S)-mandelate dehydrogenase [compost metagenome]
MRRLGAQDRVDIYLDGGIQHGTDVIKALALGAKAVFIGRAALWGLSVSGEQGVMDVLSILKKEFILAMQLCGCKDIRSVTPALLATTHSRL